MIGLVLQGGGARGSYQVGAVNALRKKGIKFDGVVGTSIGSINGAFIASKEYGKLKKLWYNANSKTMFDIDEDIINAFEQNKLSKDIIKRGINTASEIIKSRGIDTKFLKKMLDENVSEKKLRNSKIEYGLVTYNMTDRKPVQVFTSDIPKGKLTDYLLASAYFPLFKFEKIIDNKFYFDGGIYDDCPADMLLNLGYDEIYIIRSYAVKLQKFKSKTASITEIGPKKGIGALILFNQERMRENMKLGYYDTLRVLDNLDGEDYYIKNESEEFYKSLFEEYDKKTLLFEIKINAFASQKKIILKILEKLAHEYKLNKYKVYSVNGLIIRLKIMMRHDKNNKYYKFINSIKLG